MGLLRYVAEHAELVLPAGGATVMLGPYVIRLFRMFMLTVREHARSPGGRTLALHLWCVFIRELESLLTNRDSSDQLRDWITGSRLSDWRLARLAGHHLWESVRANGFAITFFWILIGAGPVTVASLVDDGIRGFMVHAWLFVAIIELSHRIVNPRRVGPMRRLVPGTVNAAAALTVMALDPSLVPEELDNLSLVLLALAIIAMASLTAYALIRGFARTKRAIVSARLDLAWVLRWLIAAGLMAVLVPHRVMILSSSTSGVTRVALACFSACTVAGVVLRAANSDRLGWLRSRRRRPHEQDSHV